MSVVNEKKRKKEADSNSSKTNLPEGYTRATFTIKEDLVRKLKAVAWWERKTIREVLEQILEHDLSSRKLENIFHEMKKNAEKKIKVF